MKSSISISIIMVLILICSCANPSRNGLTELIQPTEIDHTYDASIRQRDAEIERLCRGNEEFKGEVQNKPQSQSSAYNENIPYFKPANKSTTSRKVISYNELLRKYSISGNGRYGYVSLDASYLEILDKLTIYGTVGESYISLDSNHLEILNKTLISGGCGDFGYASLDIHTLDILGKATLSGSVGNNYIDISVTGVN